MNNLTSRFWNKYTGKTVACNVLDGAQRWHMKYIDRFIKSSRPSPHRKWRLGYSQKPERDRQNARIRLTVTGENITEFC
jgi:hypothetical protein